jgi:di/tricarboxylate transporter
LKPATDQVFKLNSPRRERLLIEAVVSPTHPVNGKTIKDGGFRNIYDAVVLAVSRNGERVKEKVGDIRLKTGDTLLLEAHPNFLEQYKNSSDYYLTSGISNSAPPDYKKSGIAWSILGIMVATAAFGIFSMFEASFLAAGMMIVTNCCNATVAKDYIDWSVLLVIAASLGIGGALEYTGAATVVAEGFLSYAEHNPHLALAGVY